MARIYGNNPNHWQAYCDYGVSSTDTTTTISISAAGFRSVAWGFQLTSGVSVTASCTGQTSKSGSGGFSSGTGATVEKSFVSGSWSVARTTSAQTLTVTVTVANSSGYMDGTSTLSFQVTVPALPSYAVTYSANGGSGAPSAQTKWHGRALALSSARPTRAGYIFQGWATSASGAVAYQPGASYAGNAALALYAVWRLAYVAPTISSCSAQRCSSSGTAQDGGTYAKVTAKWAVSTAYSSANKATSVKVEYRKKGASAWTSGATQAPNAASGTLSAVVGGGSLTADDQWEFRVTVADPGGSSTAQCSVAGQYYPMDVGNKGKTVAFGRAASSTAGLEVGMPARFDSTVQVSGRLQCDDVFRPYAGQYAHATNGTTNVAGYMRVARFTVKDKWANSHATFEISQRARNGTVDVEFQNANTLDPALNVFRVYGGTGSVGAYMHKASAGVWDLYVQKSEANDYLSVTAFHPSSYFLSHVATQFATDQVASLPSGSVPAVKAGMASTEASGGWTVRRHYDGSGLVEAFYRASVGSVAMTSNYYDRFWFASKTLAFPVTFKTVCLCQLTPEVGGDVELVSVHNVTTTAASYYVGCLGRSWTSNAIINAHVVGTV